MTLKLSKTKTLNPSTKKMGYRTTVKSNGKADMDSLVASASKNTTLHKAELRMAFELMLDAIKENLSVGNIVELKGIGNIGFEQHEVGLRPADLGHRRDRYDRGRRGRSGRPQAHRFGHREDRSLHGRPVHRGTEIRLVLCKQKLAPGAKPLREMDKIVYPVCKLCRDHERSGFVEGIKIGVRLRTELTEE